MGVFKVDYRQFNTEEINTLKTQAAKFALQQNISQEKALRALTVSQAVKIDNGWNTAYGAVESENELYKNAANFITKQKQNGEISADQFEATEAEKAEVDKNLDVFNANLGFYEANLAKDDTFFGRFVKSATFGSVGTAFGGAKATVENAAQTASGTATTFAFVGRTALDMLGAPDKADKIAGNAIDKFAEALKNTDPTSEANTLLTKALLYEMMGDYYNAGVARGMAYATFAATSLSGVKNVGKKLGKNGGGTGNAKTDGKTNTKNPETTLNAKGELVGSRGVSTSGGSHTVKKLVLPTLLWLKFPPKHAPVALKATLQICQNFCSHIPHVLSLLSCCCNPPQTRY